MCLKNTRFYTNVSLPRTLTEKPSPEPERYGRSILLSTVHEAPVPQAPEVLVEVVAESIEIFLISTFFKYFHFQERETTEDLINQKRNALELIRTLIRSTRREQHDRDNRISIEWENQELKRENDELELQRNRIKDQITAKV